MPVPNATLNMALLSSVFAQRQVQTRAQVDDGATLAAAPTPEQARQLIERLSGGGQPGVETQVTYGAVPETLSILLGDAFTVAGTLRTNDNTGQNFNYRIYVNSALPGAEARVRLRADLAATGWAAQGDEGQPISFAPPQGYANYYRAGTGSEGNYALSVIFGEKGGQTVLDLNASPISAGQLQNIRRNPASKPQSNLPLL